MRRWYEWKAVMGRNGRRMVSVSNMRRDKQEEGLEGRGRLGGNVRYDRIEQKKNL